MIARFIFQRMEEKNMVIKTRKILPISKPILTTYPEYGNLFSMLNLDDPRVWGWIITNFLHIHTYKEGFTVYKNHFYLHSQCPFLHTFIFPREYILSHYSSLTELITYFIDENYYILLNLDRYYLSNTKNYQTMHVSHQTFIYGYDLKKNIVYIADNLDNEKYVQKEYNLNEVDQAFKELYPTGYKYDDEVKFIKRIDCERYYFDIQYLIEELRLYNDSEMLNVEEVYRFANIHRYNLKAVEYQAELLAEKENCDFRPFHLFYEHKCLMELRLQYLFNYAYLDINQSLIDESRDIKNQYQVILTKIIKNKMKNVDSINVYKEIVQNVYPVIKKERSFIHKLMVELENTNN